MQFENKEQVIPIEVKAGPSKRIKSMQIYLDTHPHSPYGIRFWASQKEISQKIISYPLYAVIKPLCDNNKHMLQAILHLAD